MGVDAIARIPEVPLPQNSVSVRPGATALNVYAPGCLGELIEIIDPELVDAVLEDAGVRTQRLRLLPVRVVVYFVLALTFFERSSYRSVWAKLTAGLGSVPVAHPCASSLARARRRLGSGPLRHLFSILAGPVADHRQSQLRVPRAVGEDDGEPRLDHPHLNPLPVRPGTVAALQDRGEVGAVGQRTAHSRAPFAGGAQHEMGPGILHGLYEVEHVPNSPRAARRPDCPYRAWPSSLAGRSSGLPGSRSTGCSRSSGPAAGSSSPWTAG